MYKYKFVKFAYTDAINGADIDIHINALRRKFGHSISIQHFNTSHYNVEQADYVCHTINDNPI